MTQLDYTAHRAIERSCGMGAISAAHYFIWKYDAKKVLAQRGSNHFNKESPRRMVVDLQQNAQYFRRTIN